VRGENYVNETDKAKPASDQELAKAEPGEIMTRGGLNGNKKGVKVNMHFTRNSKIFEKDWFFLALMTAIVIIFCNRILFTEQIIRASDVTTQFFWGAKGLKEVSLLAYLQSFPDIFKAGWELLMDGGRTLEGGWNAIGLLFHRFLIQHFLPFPSCIAWLAVLAMCWGAAGTFLYCRLIGIGRLGAFTAGLLFVLCTENASLINAGHIQKLESICWTPWVVLFFEKALRSRRFFHYALTSLMLAIQFFHMHWQISFYTCLLVGVYWIFYVAGKWLVERKNYVNTFSKDLFLVVVMVGLFFSTIAMSFAPIYSWSQQSERGKALSGTSAGSSGANADKGIGFEEGMSWSMPPEEILSFLVPGLVGFSRQEGGDVPTAEQVYYWGRMRFTQTNDYLGLLPWFLIPVALLFRRDRYTWFFSFLMSATLIMALGKYTFVYRFMFEHLPAFSSFRVPKMILFLFAFGAAVLSGKGIDILANGGGERKKISSWFAFCSAVVAAIGLVYLVAVFGAQKIIPMAAEFITAPTRYQSGNQLVEQRYSFLLHEAGTAFFVGCFYLSAFFVWWRKLLSGKIILPILVVILLVDLWRVDDRFFVITAPPQANKKIAKNDIVTFLEPKIGTYRMQPLNDESASYYADNGFANISAYVTISEKRYKQFLDTFNLSGPMADMMNLKYLIVPAYEYESQKTAQFAKYTPVFSSSNGSVVLENRSVLPKAWLVPSVEVVTDPDQRLAILSSNSGFNPAMVALVETPPPIELAPYGQTMTPGVAKVDKYSANQIVVSTSASSNSLLILGEKYYRWWVAKVDGKASPIVPVNHILRGVYIGPGEHRVEFVFDPLPFKIGKYFTLGSIGLFIYLLIREFFVRRRLRQKTTSPTPLNVS